MHRYRSQREMDMSCERIADGVFYSLQLTWLNTHWLPDTKRDSPSETVKSPHSPLNFVCDVPKTA